MPFVEIVNNETHMYDTYFTTEKCLVLDGGSYASEEDAERALRTILRISLIGQKTKNM